MLQRKIWIQETMQISCWRYAWSNTWSCRWWADVVHVIVPATQ
jgi:hypothetical protein